jgi:hypothetical protein
MRGEIFDVRSTTRAVPMRRAASAISWSDLAAICAVAAIGFFLLLVLALMVAGFNVSDVAGLPLP